MARARFIRPEFFTDDKLSELPLAARLLFAGTWCHSDLRGVFEHSAKLLRVQVFPFDEAISVANVTEWLDMLKLHGFISTFEAEGKTWGYILKWKKHQTISGREAQVGSKRPQPPSDTSVVHVNDTSMVQDPTRAATPTLTLTPTTTPALACESGNTPPPASMKGKESKASNRYKLIKALRTHGMAWKDDAFSEWADMLQGRGGARNIDEVLWLVNRIAYTIKCVTYARQAMEHIDRLADELDQYREKNTDVPKPT